VENGTIKEIISDKDDPMSEGSICPKGLASVQVVYHPDRIKRPLIRVGGRGEGRWRETSWEEALDLVANTLLRIKQESGAEAVVMARGTNRGSWIRVFNRFANAFGTPNWTESGGAQCYTPRALAQTVTLGGRALEWPDLPNTECVLVWGANPPMTWPLKSKKLMTARKRGAKLIVVDPILTSIASKADIWLPVRPGTDVALALGLLNIIINEGLYDPQYVEKYCWGFDKLRERVEKYTPRKVSEITWVEERAIVDAGRLFATTKPACIEVSCTLDEIVDPIQAGRVVSILAAVTGNVDIKGGNVFPSSAGQVPIDSRAFTLVEDMAAERRDKRLGAGSYPLLSKNLEINEPMAHWPTILKAILTGEPYPVRGMFVMGGNPMLSLANSKQVEEAFRKVEFLVVTDLFISKTAQLADVVLPAASWLEQDGLVDSTQATNGHLRIRRKVASVGDAKSDIWIMIELAKRLDLHEFWESEEAYFNYILKPLGLTFREFDNKGGTLRVNVEYGRRLEKGFKTPSGRIELYSRLLEKWGYDPLPFFEEPHESPYHTLELADHYPFVMTTGRRVSSYFHTGLRNVPALRDIKPEPELDINARTAHAAGIDDGDVVIVETPYGSVKLKAKLTEGIHPRVVGVPHGWPDESNDNLLTNNEFCSLGIGTTPLRGTLCNVRRVL